MGSNSLAQALHEGVSHAEAGRTVEFAKDPNRCPDLKPSWGHLVDRADAARRCRRYLLADILICRGDKRGFDLLLEVYESFDCSIASGREYPTELAKEKSVYSELLLIVTGRFFSSSGELRDWMENELPDLQFDMSEAPYVERTPRLK